MIIDTVVPYLHGHGHSQGLFIVSNTSPRNRANVQLSQVLWQGWCKKREVSCFRQHRLRKIKPLFLSSKKKKQLLLEIKKGKDRKILTKWYSDKKYVKTPSILTLFKAQYAIPDDIASGYSSFSFYEMMLKYIISSVTVTSPSRRVAALAVLYVFDISLSSVILCFNLPFVCRIIALDLLQCYIYGPSHMPQ